MRSILAAGKPFEAYAVIVDINGFTPMVKNAVNGPSGGQLIATFVSDCLIGAVSAIESNDGEVVGTMGDAILAFVPGGDERIFKACVAVARDLDLVCEYISSHQKDYPHDWDWSPGGPSLKITVEWGRIDVADVTTRFLGKEKLFIGSAINYAARIGVAGRGNRCHLGPAAARRPELEQFAPAGPYDVNGKAGEQSYQYFVLDLSDVWREGERGPEDESYWG